MLTLSTRRKLPGISPTIGDSSPLVVETINKNVKVIGESLPGKKGEKSRERRMI